MENKILDDPTVAEVIKALSEYPPDAKFAIEDADTNDIITVIHVSDSIAYGGGVQFSWAYGEME
jgi:hypothetical protein